jgi:predicted RNA-binding protein with PUA-like domain
MARQPETEPLAATNYWLIKSEPEAFGIDHLQASQTTVWDGIRNYQARNYLRTAQVGDLAFFYHSNTAITGLAGLCKIIATQVVDPTQFDPASDYYDATSLPDNPRWVTVKVQFVEKFPRVITLDELKTTFSPDELVVVRKGNRLSVMPVSSAAAQRLLALGYSEKITMPGKE